jgi:hypothetical protein
MEHVIKELILGDVFERYDVPDAQSPKRLAGLGKINVFVGENNSGKSRLIRTIAAKRDHLYEPAKELLPFGVPLRESANLIQAIKDHLNTCFARNGIQSANNLLARIGDFSSTFQTVGLVEGASVFQKLMEFIHAELRKPAADSVATTKAFVGESDRSNALKAIREWATHCLTELSAISKLDHPPVPFSHIYIPTLRSLRNLGDNDVLAAQTRKDYKLDNKIEVFSGQTAFQEVRKLALGNLTQRKLLRDYELWLGKTFFRGEQTALIPREGHRTLTVKIGDEQEKEIHELGDGIQSIIVLTFPLFSRVNDYVLAFIEEPELFLHPWLQRVF